VVQRDARVHLDLKSTLPGRLDIYRRNGVEAFTDLATRDEVKKNADLSAEVLKNLGRLQRAPAAKMSGPLLALSFSGRFM